MTERVTAQKRQRETGHRLEARCGMRGEDHSRVLRESARVVALRRK